jgi:hypothetical protein
MLQVFTIILYQNVSQNPELFGTQVSLSPEQSTLMATFKNKNNKKNKANTKPLELNATSSRVKPCFHARSAEILGPWTITADNVQCEASIFEKNSYGFWDHQWFGCNL